MQKHSADKPATKWSATTELRPLDPSDITEQDRAALSLEASDERYRLLADAMPHMVWTMSPDRVIQTVNRRWLVFTGMTLEEVQQIGWHPLIHPDDLHELLAFVAGPLERGEAHELELRMRRHDGVYRHVLARTVPVHDQNGAVVDWVGTTTDIENRWLTESDLKRSETRLKISLGISQILAESDTLESAAPRILSSLCEQEGFQLGAIWTIDEQSAKLSCVHVWHRPDDRLMPLVLKTQTMHFKWGEGVLGRVWSGGAPVLVPDVGAEPSFMRAAEALQAGLKSYLAFPILLAGTVTGVVEFIAPEIQQLDTTFSEMLNSIGTQIGLFIDRRHDKEKVDRFVAYSPTVLYAAQVENGKLQHTWTSENILQLTGYSAENLTDEEWIEMIHPEDRDRVVSAHAPPYEVDHQIIEYRLLCKDGGYLWLRDEKRLLRDQEGKAVEVIGAVSDVSDRVQLETKLLQSQKMEAIGQLAGGVAHDFNNLLTIMMGYSEILLAEMPPDHPLHFAASSIAEASERATGLTRQLLAFSRQAVLAPKLVNVNDIVEETEKMLRRLIGEDITLSVVLDPEIELVVVDPGQLGQVLLNLAVNARDAMPRGGRLTIETTVVEFEESAVAVELKPGRYVMLAMTDTGCGMSPEVKSRIFEPFFTTKGQGRGTGLGLATVYGILRQSGGHIEVYSEQDVGTAFKIYLPAVARESDLPARDKGVVLPLTGTEVVLLVEDEDAVRRVARIALETQGYTVICASNGAQALQEFDASERRIDLLVTDVVMPGISGRELAEELQSRQQSLKVLFLSGYTDDAIVRHGVLSAEVAFLQKPYTPLSISKKVRQVLDQP